MRGSRAGRLLGQGVEAECDFLHSWLAERFHNNIVAPDRQSVINKLHEGRYM